MPLRRRAIIGADEENPFDMSIPQSDTTAGFSTGRNLWKAFGVGPKVTQTGTLVDYLYDQSGNGRHLESTTTSRPTLINAGPKNRPAMLFAGGNDYMQADNSLAISNFISNSSGWCVVSVMFTAFVLDGANIYQDDMVWGDSSRYVGTYARATGPTVAAYNWDGNADLASTTSLVTGIPYVLEWVHTDGNVIQRINAGTTITTASGNTQVMTGIFSLGGTTSASQAMSGYIWEFTIASTVPSEAVRNQVVQQMGKWCGAF